MSEFLARFVPLPSEVMEADDLTSGRTTSGSGADAWSEQARADEAIADALDAVEAERVFARALELEAEAIEQPHLFTANQLERIADEINMDVTFVRQALGEVRLSPEERSRLDRWILPDPIMEVETVEGLPRADLDALIDDWMQGHEGLIAAANLPDGTQWDVDRRLAARFRAMRLAGGNRISRAAGGDVAHRVHTIGEDEHVVAMQARGEGPLLLAKLGLALGAALVGVGIVAGINDTPVQFLQLVSALGLLGVGVGVGAVAGARRWAKGIGRALRRSLTGLVGRIGGRRARRFGDSVDLRPAVTQLLTALTARVKEQRARRQGTPRPSDRRHPPPPRRGPPPPPGRTPPPPRR